MRYRLLGPSGLRVSEAALGTMTFGEAWGWGASLAESRRIFGTYAEAGGNFVDTACNSTQRNDGCGFRCCKNWRRLNDGIGWGWRD